MCAHVYSKLYLSPRPPGVVWNMLEKLWNMQTCVWILFTSIVNTNNTQYEMLNKNDVMIASEYTLTAH